MREWEREKERKITQVKKREREKWRTLENKEKRRGRERERVITQEKERLNECKRGKEREIKLDWKKWERKKGGDNETFFFIIFKNAT